MSLIKMDKARETAPIVLNLIKDTGWCYTWGVISVITIVPVLTFQVYEVWKSRKEGTHKVIQNIIATFAVAANGTWMIGDLYFHDRLRPYVKWMFNAGFVFLGLYMVFVVISLWRNNGKPQAETTRTMTVSKDTRGLVFIHTRRTGGLSRRLASDPRVMMVRHKKSQ